MAKKKNKSMNQAKGGLMTALTVVMLAGVVLGWTKANHIDSPKELYSYFKAWSDKTDEKIKECKFGDLQWECREGESPNSPGKAPKDATNIGTSPPKSSPNDPGVDIPPPGGSTGDLILSADAKKFQATLNILTVKNPTVVDYDRSDWKHWAGSPCNTRIEVLVRDGTDVKVEKKGSSCKVVSGKWNSVYEDKEFTEARGLDIDHVIPLSYAARQGGQAWPAEKKTAFANDMTQLLAVSAKENRSKGDKGPGEYMPPAKDYHCSYSKIWISTVKKYELTITKEDKTALTNGLKEC